MHGYSLFIWRALVSTIEGNFRITLNRTSRKSIEINSWGRFLKGGINYTRYNSYSTDKSAILGITIPGIKMGSRTLFILGIAIPGISLLL